MRVLFTSGYLGHEAVDPGMRGRFRDFIQKPVAPDDLARKVRSMLDAK